MGDAFLLIAAAAVPWCFGPWLADRWALPKLLAGSVCVAAAALARMREGSVRGSAVDAPVLALAAVALASALTCADPWTAWFGQYGSYAHGILGWTLCAAAFWLSGSAAEGFTRRLVFWTCAGAVPVAAYALLQRAGWEPDEALARYFLMAGARRPLSSIGAPAPLGMYLALVLPLAVHLSWRAQGTVRRIALAAGALVAPALAVTGSRSAWLGALSGLAVLALSGRKLPRRSLMTLTAACVLCLAAMILLTARRWESDLERRAVWEGSVAILREQPALGAGPDGFARAWRKHRRGDVLSIGGDRRTQTDAHDDWLQIAATLGLFGIAAYLWIHWRASRVLAKTLRADIPGEERAVIAGLAAVFVTAKLNVMAWQPLFLSSLLAGRLLAGRQGRIWGFWRRAALPAIAVLPLFACLRLAWADRLARLGDDARRAGSPREAAGLYERAVAANPRETAYRMRLENLLWESAWAAADTADARSLLRRAAEVAVEGARLRPADPDALHLLGRAELRRADWGGERGRLEPARLFLGLAEGLDPHLPELKADMARLRELGL